jgi:isoleucyl-tRNA synthetase
LPVEFEIDKELGIKTSGQVLEYGIDKYNEACRGIVLRYASEWETIMGKLGRWIDFKHDYKTMTLEFMNSTWWVFKKLFEKGRIYEGQRVMPYSTACGTPLSNFETQENYKEVQDDSLFICLPMVSKFKDLDVNLMVWTTTPWTLPSNYALCVNLEIEYSLVMYKSKYYILATSLINSVFKESVELIVKLCTFSGKELVGLEYIPPFNYNTQMKGSTYKILSDGYVTEKDGTGIVHIAPAYGTDDYRVCLESGLITKEDELFQPLDVNGFVSNAIPEFVGMFYKNFNDKSRQDLNTKVIIMLKQSGYYFDKRQIVHNYPFCWRSDTPLIYRSISSWFVKVEDLRERMVELNSTINWVPGHVGQARFSNWLANAKDWGISRNRFWGTPIPIWKSDDGDVICVGSSYELEKLAGLEPNSLKDIHRHFIDDIKIISNGKVYKRIELVLDCWFESGSMPYSSLGTVGIVELERMSESGIEYTETGNPYIKTVDGKEYSILPADFIAEGLDQTRGWFYTLMVLSTSLFDMIPFKNVIVNGLVLASDGKKMSKRLKNYPDPMTIVSTYSSDCLRLYLLNSPAVRAEPLKFSESGVRAIMKDILIPYKNTFAFFKEYFNLYLLEQKKNPLTLINLDTLANPINVWLIYQYQLVRTEYKSCMEQYDLRGATQALANFVEIFNNGYIKLGRNVLKGKEGNEVWSESLSTMYYVLKYFVFDFKAIIPYFVESQYLEMKQLVNKLDFSDDFFIPESIHLNDMYNDELYIQVKSSEKYCMVTDFDIVYNIINTIYKLRGSINMTAKKPFKSVLIAVSDGFDEKYSVRYKEYLTFVTDECNIMEIDVIKMSGLTIGKNIVPLRGPIFKKYGKEISETWNKLSSLTNAQLEEILVSGTFSGYTFDSSMFDITNTVELSDSSDSADYIFKELNYFDMKLIILADKTYDESLDKLFYYRVVGTRVQRARKFGLFHPWEKINCYYSGTPKYPINEKEASNFIKSITNYELVEYSGQHYTYEHDFTEECGLTIYLEKLE